jgi:hypothetical protein
MVHTEKRRPLEIDETAAELWGLPRAATQAMREPFKFWVERW